MESERIESKGKMKVALAVLLLVAITIVTVLFVVRYNSSASLPTGTDLDRDTPSPSSDWQWSSARLLIRTDHLTIAGFFVGDEVAYDVKIGDVITVWGNGPELLDIKVTSISKDTVSIVVNGEQQIVTTEQEWLDGQSTEPPPCCDSGVWNYIRYEPWRP
ncbi:MAG: hypothetical protein LBN10_00170 [Propionibacteriaceae bacterium]|jgi:hypothetical protein|nr:hypothetical protein [Propionibacteriaceae bacterium]